MKVRNQEGGKYFNSTITALYRNCKFVRQESHFKSLEKP